MWKLFLSLGLVFAVQGVVLADEPPPVVNDPSGFWDKAKQVIDRSEPRAGVIVNLEAAEIQATTGAKLYAGEINGYAVEGVLSYGINKSLIASVETDVLLGISKFTGWTMQVPWLSVNAGPGVGFSWDAQADGKPTEGSNFVYGLMVNASAKF